MKNIIFAMAMVCLAAGAAYAQKISIDKVPAIVQASFKKQFTSVTKPQWEMESADYEVTFQNKGVESSAKYDKQGAWLETEEEIKEAELPAVVKQEVEKQFPGFKMNEVEKASYPGNKIAYEMEMSKGKEAYNVQFSSEGKLLKKEVQNKKEKKD